MILGKTQPEDVYGNLQLNTILRKHFESDLELVDVHVKWLRFKLSGDNKRYILRIWEFPDDHRFGGFNLRREVNFILYCQQIGFPHILKMVAFDFDRDMIEYDYYIYEFVEGLDFYQVTQICNEDEKAKLYENLGTVIGKMHSHKVVNRMELTMKRNGEIGLTDAEPWKYNPEHDWIYHHYNQIYGYAEKYPVLRSYLDPISQLFEKFGEFRKNEPRTIGLVHLDLASDNLIVTNKGQSIDDFFMIDFTFAGLSWISLDLARIERRFTTWRNTLPLDEIEIHLKLMFNAYERVTEVPLEYIEEEAVILKLIQLIDDFWMFEKVDHWLSQDKERGLKVRLWELDRMIDKYL